MPKWTPAFYGLALLSFFLPFTRISCADQTLMAANGTQLVTGFNIENPLAKDRKDSKSGDTAANDASTKVKANPWVIAALALALLGLLASLGSPKGWVARFAGIGLAISLLAFKVTSEQQATGELQKLGGVVRLDFLFGFWCALGSGIAAAISARSGQKDDTPQPLG